MRRSHLTETLVIVSNHTKSVYDDRWIGEIFHYTGMGQTGHQSLKFSQNRTLNLSASNGVAVHLFEVFVPQQYTYIGEVQLESPPYQESQLDAKKIMRTVWVFPLQLKTALPPAISAASLQQLIALKQRKISRMSDAEVEHAARRTEQRQVSQRASTTTYFQRSIWIAEHAKRRAKGKCELCVKNAPFLRKNGEPYLETHHIQWLANGGFDTIENTVALCPNCHRRMHTLNSNTDIKILQNRAKFGNNRTKPK